MAAAPRKRSNARATPKGREEKPPGGPVWDPAAVPAESAAAAGAPPTLAEEKERAFHATHFSADPRGTGKAGAPPPGNTASKHRGGTPPPPTPGTAGPERTRSGPADA
jgi:hypothetical protein